MKLWTPVLDHLVITPKDYYSFEDDGQMEELSWSTKWEPNYVPSEKMRARAEKIGRELGRKEGEEKRSLEIAAELKRSGIDLATIQKATGLSEDAIRKLS